MKKRRKSILCIDKSVLVLGILGSALRTRGFAVLCANDGQAGLAMMDTTPIDAVIVDLEMPGMNGIAVARRIKATKAEIPIILFTGEVPGLVKELPQEINHFVAKPDLAKLLSTVTKSTSK
jgi:two-component system sensor histidine kinase and response regulator WspE